jgi:hypothetical protein
MKLRLLLLVAGTLPAHVLAQSPAEPALPSPPSRTSIVQNDEREAAIQAHEAIVHAKWNICVDVQMVSLDEMKALDLISEFQSDDDQKIEVAWTKLQAMIKTKEGTLLGWPMVRMVDGDRATTESAVEKRYATEFTPPEDRTPPIPVDKPAVETALPSAFETRNVGVTLDVEARVLDDGKRVYRNVSPQRVELLEMEKNESPKAKDNTVVQVPQPKFGNTRTTQSLTIKSGQRFLLAVHKLGDSPNQVELCLVHAIFAKAE